MCHDLGQLEDEQTPQPRQAPYVLYPFGHGLSYAGWRVVAKTGRAPAPTPAPARLSISVAELRAGGSVSVSATVTHVGRARGSRSGQLDGRHAYEAVGSSRAVLLFACRAAPGPGLALNPPLGWPRQWLAGFSKVHAVPPGGSAVATIEVGLPALEQHFDGASRALEVAVGTYRLWFSDTAADCSSSDLEVAVTA